MLIVSTGYKALIFGTTSFSMMFNGGCIELRDGVMPDSPNLAPTGTVLAKVTNNGGVHTNGSPTNGLTFAIDENANVVAAPGSNWVMTGLVDGTATWCRLRGVTDDGAISVVTPRIDIQINSEDGVGLAMPTAVIVAGQQKPCTFFVYGIPPFS